MSPASQPPRGFRRLFHLGSPATVERDVDEEIRFHIDSRAAELVGQGVTPAAAREQAEREYGEVAASRAELVALDRRRLVRARRLTAVHEWGHDLRTAARALRARPAFTALVVAVLALGVGANATTFALADQLLFRPPAYLRDPELVGRVYFSRTSRGSEVVDAS
jgi:putative ABC transport system permease protein